MRLSILFCILFAFTRLADAQPSTKLKPEAQAHLDAFLKAYEKKDWDAALRELDLAYVADANPALLYSKAQTLRLAGRCEDAIAVYKKYIDQKVTTEQQAAARGGIQTCEKVIASQPKPEPPKPEPPKPEPPKPEPKPVAEPPKPIVAQIDPTPPIQTPPANEGPRAWYKDPVAGALVGGGVVGVVVGLVFIRKGAASEDAAKDQEFRDDFLAKLDDAESQRRIGYVALGAGVALVAGGVVKYVLARSASKERITATTDGRSIFIAGSF